MSKEIIDNINYLHSLSSDDLEELLLEDKYNKDNLRELVRRLLDSNKDWMNACKSNIEERARLENKIRRFKDEF